MFALWDWEQGASSESKGPCCAWPSWSHPAASSPIRASRGGTRRRKRKNHDPALLPDPPSRVSPLSAEPVAEAAAEASLALVPIRSSPTTSTRWWCRRSRPASSLFRLTPVSTGSIWRPPITPLSSRPTSSISKVCFAFPKSKWLLRPSPFAPRNADGPCLATFSSNGHIQVFSLPSLRPLMDTEFCPLVDLR